MNYRTDWIAHRREIYWGDQLAPTSVHLNKHCHPFSRYLALVSYSRREKSRAREQCCALTFSGLFEALKIFFSQILFFPLKIKVLQIKVFIFKINFFFLMYLNY